MHIIQAPFKMILTEPRVHKITGRLGNASGVCFKGGEGWPFMKHLYRANGKCRRCDKVKA